MTISMVNVAKRFGSISVLEDISFNLARGERASLIGPGGCGKSTILKLILGLVEPDEGEVYLRGTVMRKASEHQRNTVLKKVGMAFQQGGLFDYMTVRENLMFAMEHMTGLSPDEMAAKITQLLAGVKLASTENLYPHELSGGMKRRVGIARALATDPEVAIFDEPTSGLDPVTSTIILNMIDELAASSGQTTTLVATTSVEIAIRFSKRLIVVHDGLVVADGDWRELLLDGPEWVRHFLGTRLIGLDLEYANELSLPERFIAAHW